MFSEIRLHDFFPAERRLSPSIGSVEELLNYRFEGAPLGAMVVGEIAYERLDSLWKFDEGFGAEEAQEMLNSGIDLYLATRKIIREFDVQHTYFWNGRRISDGPVWWASRAEGIASSFYISGQEEGKYVVGEKSSIQEAEGDYKNFCLWRQRLADSGKSALAVRAGRKLLEDYRLGTWTGVSWVHWGRGNGKRVSTGEEIFTILLSSPIEEIHSEAYRRYFWPNPYRWVVKLVEFLSSTHPGVEIHVKWHPAQSLLAGEERRVIQRTVLETSGAIHHPPESNVDAYSLVQHSKVVFSVGSTVGLWAAANSIPLVVLGPRGELQQEAGYWVKSDNFAEEIGELLESGGLAAKDSDEAALIMAFQVSDGIEFEHLTQVRGKNAFFRPDGARLSRGKGLSVRARFFKYLQGLSRG